MAANAKRLSGVVISGRKAKLIRGENAHILIAMRVLDYGHIRALMLWLLIRRIDAALTSGIYYKKAKITKVRLPKGGRAAWRSGEARGPWRRSVSEAVLRTEREGRRRLELAPRLRAVEANRASARVDERAGRVHAQVGVVEVPAHE